MSELRFALIGAAGFVAPRHMKAIKEVGGDLLAAVDPSDSVGVIDSYFPDAKYFVEFERFDRHIDKLRRSGGKIDYVGICSPNYLHDAHTRYVLRAEADAICEKPLVLNPWNLDALAEMEKDTGQKINTILQLRLHPSIVALKQAVEAEPGKIHEVDITYIAGRGGWYFVSWKGDDAKSGGVATNIGVHFFDMLAFLFGGVRENISHLREPSRSAGYIELDRARVRWFLSVDRADLPDGLREGQSTYRSITVDGETVEFSDGFVDLHTESYRKVLAGEGFGLNDVRPSIEMVSDIRRMDPTPNVGERHPFVNEAGG